VQPCLMVLLAWRSAGESGRDIPCALCMTAVLWPPKLMVTSNVVLMGRQATGRMSLVDLNRARSLLLTHGVCAP